MAGFDIHDFLVEEHADDGDENIIEGIHKIIHNRFITRTFSQHFRPASPLHDVPGDAQGFRENKLSIPHVGQVGEVPQTTRIFPIIIGRFVNFFLELNPGVGEQMPENLASASDSPIAQHKFIAHLFNVRYDKQLLPMINACEKWKLVGLRGSNKI